MRFRLLAAALAVLSIAGLSAQKTGSQKVDEPYTALIKQYLQDPRITT